MGKNTLSVLNFAEGSLVFALFYIIKIRLII